MQNWEMQVLGSLFIPSFSVLPASQGVFAVALLEMDVKVNGE